LKDRRYITYIYVAMRWDYNLLARLLWKAWSIDEMKIGGRKTYVHSTNHPRVMYMPQMLHGGSWVWNMVFAVRIID